MRKSASRRNLESMTSPDATHGQNARLVGRFARRYILPRRKRFFRAWSNRAALCARAIICPKRCDRCCRASTRFCKSAKIGAKSAMKIKRANLSPAMVFQALVARALIEMQAGGLIHAHLIFALKPKAHPKSAPARRYISAANRCARFGFACVFGIVAPRNNLRLFG